MSNMNEKYNKLKEQIKSLESVIVSYSGGVDSTFVAKVSKDVLGKDNVLLVTAVSASRSEEDIEEAKQIAKEMDVNHIVVETNELSDKKFCTNSSDKCYHCKSELDHVFCEIKKKHSTFNYIINGTNFDDLDESRPGRKADVENNVLSPLLDCELTKQEIRELSKMLNLRTWDKVGDSCFATRIPVGDEITKEKLRQIEESEKILQKMGFNNVRVRHLRDTARIEIPREEFKYIIQPERVERIVRAIEGVGFTFVTLDLDGYVKGKVSVPKEKLKEKLFGKAKQ